MQGVRFGFGVGLGLFAVFFIVPIVFVALLAGFGSTISGWWVLLLPVGLLLIAVASWRLAAD